jgi:hypothetical protein
VPVIGSIVDGEALLKVVWVSLASGIGVTFAFAVAIVGATRAVDSSREGRTAGTVAFGALTALALAVVAGAIALGIVVMTSR